MTPNEIKANLTAEQWELYERLSRTLSNVPATSIYYQDIEKEIAALEDLAERNRLIKKYEWSERSNGSFVCHSCKAIYLPDFDESNYIDESIPGRLPIIRLGKGKIHKSDCGIDAALKGVGEHPE